MSVSVDTVAGSLVLAAVDEWMNSTDVILGIGDFADLFRPPWGGIKNPVYFVKKKIRL